MPNPAKAEAPAIDEVARFQQSLQRWLVETPVVRCRNLEYRLDCAARLYGKLEFLQQTGTFKPRGALSNVLSLDSSALASGITAVSAGNHAIAASFAARAVGTSAKVVMTKTASPVRVAACRAYGADVVLADDVHKAFELVDQIRENEGRQFVHPFEGPEVAMGTATLGLEICEQINQLDAIVIPIGGGGLCAGISSAVKQVNPECTVIGVEPEGADTMRRSFASGRPERIEDW